MEQVFYNTFSMRKIKNKISLINAFKHNLRFGKIASNVDENLTENNIILVNGYDGKNNNKDFTKFVNDIFNENVLNKLTKKFKKNAVLANEFLFSAKKEFFTQQPCLKDIWIEAINDFLKDNFPDCPVLNSVIHEDETATHFHIIIAPLVKNENEIKLCSYNYFAKEKFCLQKLHTKLAEKTKSFGLNLSRGIKKVRAKNKTIKDFYNLLEYSKENYENDFKEIENLSSFENFVKARKFDIKKIKNDKKSFEDLQQIYHSELEKYFNQATEYLKKFYFENQKLSAENEELKKYDINKDKKFFNYFDILNEILNLNLSPENNKIKIKNDSGKIETYLIKHNKIVNNNKNIPILDFLKYNYFDTQTYDGFYNIFKNILTEPDFKKLRIKNDTEKIEKTNLKKCLKNLTPKFLTEPEKINKCIENILLKNKYLKRDFLSQLFENKILQVDRNYNIVIETDASNFIAKSYFIFGTLLKRDYFKEISNNENNVITFPSISKNKKTETTIYTSDIYIGLFLQQEYNVEIKIVTPENLEKLKSTKEIKYIDKENFKYERPQVRESFPNSLTK